MNIAEWTMSQVLLFIVVPLALVTIAALIHNFKQTASAVFGMFWYGFLTLWCFLAISFTRTRRAIPKYGKKTWLCFTTWLRECWDAVTWLFSLVVRRKRTGAAKTRGLAKQLGGDEVGGSSL